MKFKTMKKTTSQGKGTESQSLLHSKDKEMKVLKDYQRGIWLKSLAL
jgi:hypothetical protein